MAYLPKTYRKTGGDTFVVASGGDIAVESGGTLNIESGGAFKIAGTQVTATAADLNTASGASTGTTSATWTLDSDSAAVKLVLDTNSATGAFTCKVVPSNLTGDVVLTLPSSTGTIALTSDTATNLDLGSSGVAGSLDIFPSTAANGKLTITATNNGGANNVNITNDAVAATRSYKIPEAGGDGKFVMTTAAYSLLVNCNAANRTMSLSGNLTCGGDVSFGGAFTTAAAVTFSGANACTITVPAGGSTVTLPASGTLLTDTGSLTGTNEIAFTVDADCTTGKFKLLNTTGGGNYTVTVQTSAPGGNRTITLPDSTGTVMLLGTTQTVSGNITNTGTLDIRGNVSSGGSNPNIDLSGSTGTFLTPTGAVTIGTGDITVSGNVAVSGNKNFDYSGSNGTFTTSSGTNTLSGHVVIADAKNLTVGSATGGPATGYVTIFSATAANGSLRLKQGNDANNKITTVVTNNAAADATITLPNATATVATVALAETLTNKTLTAPVINGCSTAVAANDFLLANSTGAFSTPSGANTLSGHVTVADGKNVTIGSATGGPATGYIAIFSATAAKGELRLKQADDANNKITTIVSNNAAANATITLPNATATLATTGLTETLVGKTLTAPVINGCTTAVAANNIDFSAGTGTFKTTAGENTISGNVTVADGKNVTIGSATGGPATGYIALFSATAAKGELRLKQADDANNKITTVVTNNAAADATITLPNATATLATLDLTETLTNKTIDGDANTVQDLLPASMKVGVEGATAVTAIPSVPFLVTITTADGAETVAYTVPAGKTLRVVKVEGYKIAQAGGAAGTLTVTNVANAITDAISLNIGDAAVFAASTYDDSRRDVAATTQLRVTTATAAGCHCETVVNIWCIWV